MHHCSFFWRCDIFVAHKHFEFSILFAGNTSAYDDDLEDISDDSLSSDLQMDNNPIDLDLEKRLLDEPTGETNY